MIDTLIVFKAKYIKKNYKALSNHQKYCLSVYLDYLNDYLSESKLAENMQVDVQTVHALIKEGKRVHNFLTEMEKARSVYDTGVIGQLQEHYADDDGKFQPQLANVVSTLTEVKRTINCELHHLSELLDDIGVTDDQRLEEIRQITTNLEEAKDEL